ncbi:MAG TPA: serine hydrolase [Gemmatimonadaceae bacterium]|nr:serine hydrolase [Gemmatimonadaceae bacterium]
MLRERILQRIAQVPGATVGVVFQDVRDGGALVHVNPDSVFHAASTMKVPVLIEYFRAVDAGHLRADQDLLLVNEFASIVDGSPYALDAGADSDSSLYPMLGTRVPLRLLAERMITRSSNLATNAMIEVVGAPRADATARALGARATKVLRGVEDGKAFQAGLSNVTTARDLAALLLAIETGTAASATRCREMLEILSRQQHNSEIPAGLPAGTRVAHKTGWITGVLHDAALVYPEGRGPYVLVVLTKGIADRDVARELIVDISRMVWERATGPR